MKKRISKSCKTLREAERFQWKLYDQYDGVYLVRSPFFEEHGLYVWEVENPK